MHQEQQTLPPEAEQQPTPEQATSVPPPEIWVGSAADYANERQYGAWLDATQPARELVAGIRGVLERTPDGLGQDWAIHDVRGFGRWRPGEHDGLPAVVNVARGIQVHGLAYSGLVSIVGADSLAARLDRFHLSYVGDWPTVDAFAAQVIRESGWTERLDRLPENMRRYLRFDMRKLIRDAKRELHIIGHDNGVWVFDPRMW